MLDIRESAYYSDYCTTSRITDVFVTSDTVDEVVKWANSTADPYCITLMYSFKDLNFLLDIPSLKDLCLTQYLVTEDMSAIEKCTNLENLTLAAECQAKCDLSSLSNLKSLGINNKRFSLPSADCLPNLERLSCCYTRSQSVDQIPFYQKLEYLYFLFGSITTLSGLERFDKLISYDHDYGKRLSDVNAVTQLKNLKHLRFGNCKKIEISPILSLLPESLDWLQYVASTDLPSLSFLKRLKNLTFMALIDTNVLDGDVTPLASLKKFGLYPNKRSYSHTEEQLMALHDKIWKNKDNVK